jgi:hypothetical protein
VRRRASGVLTKLATTRSVSLASLSSCSVVTSVSI